MRRLASLTFLLGALAASAQVPYLVKDINQTTTPVGSDLRLGSCMGDLCFFVVADPAHGYEMWRTDGTANGTYLLKDINPGPASSMFYPILSAPLNGLVFFPADDGVHGVELWASDGTSAGTRLVKDIAVGAQGSNPIPGAVFNGKLFFTATTPDLGCELWATDGTDASTTLVDDVNPGAGSGASGVMTVLGNQLLFFGYGGLRQTDGTQAGTSMVAPVGGAWLYTVGGVAYFRSQAADLTYELWKTDGTTAGTVRVKGGFPNQPVQVTCYSQINGLLLFDADDGVNGLELWRSDGTEAGTFMLSDCNPGPASSTPLDMTPLDGFVLFQTSGANNVITLWRTDGTAAGTTPVADIDTSGYGSTSATAVLNGAMLFSGRDTAHGLELWRSDGTASGTTLVKDINPGPASSISYGQFSTAASYIVFAANDGLTGQELWRTDGTAAGTTLVKNISPDTSNSSYPIWLSDLNGALLFGASDGTQFSLWTSDGTESGTVPLAPVPSPEYPYANPIVNGDLLYFVAAGYPTPYELWRSDGTTDGTLDLASLSLPNPLPTLVSGNGRIFFPAGDQTHGWEPWTSDGTVAGTSMIKDINPGQFGSLSYCQMFSFNGQAYFSANDGSGAQPWVSDGTEAGTHVLKQVLPANSTSGPSGFGTLGGLLTFFAGSSLWTSDGTEAGTSKLVDLTLGGDPTQVTTVADLLFFFVESSSDGLELWRSDGTASGTLQIAVIPTAWISIGSPTDLGGELFFTVVDGWGAASLWRSDGTTTGTIPIAQLDGGWAYQWAPPPLTRVGNSLYFAGGDDLHGVELWVSDGTADGTFMVDDTVPGAGSLDPTNLALVGSTLFFAGTTPETGTELWALSVSGALDPRRTTTSIRPSNRIAPYGSSVTLTVLVESPNGAPTGTVTLTDGGLSLPALTLTPSATLPNTSVASLTPPALEAGGHTLVASYGGDANFEPSVSLPTNESIVPAPSSTTLTSAPNPAPGGQPVTLTAAVATNMAVAARGTVTFSDAAAGVLGSAGLDATGHAVLVVGPLSGGAHFLAAQYGGEPRFLPSSSAYSELVVDTPIVCPAFTSVWTDPYPNDQLAAADLNGDGAADLVSTGSDGIPLLVRLSLGDGRLGNQAAYLPPAEPSTFVLADLNGDGRQDIITVNAGVGVFMNDGSGGFTTGWGDALFPANALAVADFNGDGFADLLGCYIGWPKIAYGDGHGGFSVGTSFEIGSLLIDSLATGDFNGDGKADLVAVDNTHGTLSILFGHGDGTFSTPVSYTMSGSFIHPPIVADLNRDGRPDIVLVDSATQDQVVLLCNPEGTLQPPVRYPFSQASATVGKVLVGDFDGDGIPDLLAVPFGSETADPELRLGNGDGTFRGPMRIATCRSITSAAAGDFNGDGKLDLALSSNDCGTQILLNSCGLHPTPNQTLTVADAGTGTGIVTSNPAGINCGATCGGSFPFETVVTLVATPVAGSAFTGWSGEGCSGTGTCQVTMDQARSVTAIFTKLVGAKYYPLTPCRIVDTRHGPRDVEEPGSITPSGSPRGSFAAGEIRSYDLTSSTACTGLPAGVTAWSLLFQFTTVTQASYLQAWPYVSSLGIGNQAPAFSESTMLGYTDRWSANSAIIPAGNDTNGSINVLVQHAGDVIVEVNGYFAP